MAFCNTLHKASMQRSLVRELNTLRLDRCVGSSTTGCAAQAPRKAFTSAPLAPRTVKASACPSEGVRMDRRQLLQVVSLPTLSLLVPAGAIAAKAPSGYTAVTDALDNYQFLYPFGWQEVAVNTADVVYKDVVEPLESVSVTITNTERKDITEFGDLKEVTDTLVKDVLTPPGQEVSIVNSSAREAKGRNYYEVEFTVKTPRYTRHQLAVVAAGEGKFYTLTTGANERRWGKMKDKLSTVVRSFNLIN